MSLVQCPAGAVMHRDAESRGFEVAADGAEGALEGAK
jgi:hypothetical protein